jgi:hypothetical protein
MLESGELTSVYLAATIDSAFTCVELDLSKNWSLV